MSSSTREKWWWQKSSGFVHLLWCANHPFLNRDTAPNPILVGGQHQTRKNQYDEFSHHAWISGNTLFTRCFLGLYKSHIFRMPFTLLLWFLWIAYFLHNQYLQDCFIINCLLRAQTMKPEVTSLQKIRCILEESLWKSK